MKLPRSLPRAAALALCACAGWFIPVAADAAGSFLPTYEDLVPVATQPTGHPRLFFDAEDLPDLAPFVAAHPTLAATRDLILNADATDLWVSRAQNYGYAYWLTGDPLWSDKARDMVLLMISDASRWEVSNPRALTAGGDIWSVAQAYDACAESWAGQTVPASVSATIRTTNGTQFFTRDVPARYVGRDLKDAVSEALARNSFILLYRGTGSGWPGDGKTGNNWFAWRYASPILGLLASDHPVVDSWNRDTAIDDALRELRKYLNSKYTTSDAARGWDPEGHGYNFYPGMVMWPTAYALKRLRGVDLLADYPGARYTQWTTLVSTIATGGRDFNNPIPGIHPDFSDDNIRSAFQGTASIGFAFVPHSYLGGYRFMFDHLVGLDAEPLHQRFDFDHGGGMWTILFYPNDRSAEDPATVWNNAFYDPSFGIAMFRQRFQDRDDIVMMATANLRGTVGGHEGLDQLTWRLFGFGEAWVAGAGRTQDVRPMPHVFPVDPLLSAAWPAGEPWGQSVEDIYQRGNGDGIMIMSNRLGDSGVRNHRRKIMIDYSGSTGASAFMLVHDTSDNGVWWRLPVIGDKDLSISGNTFTFTSLDTGAKLIGKVLRPAGGNLFERDFRGVQNATWLRADGTLTEGYDVKALDVAGNDGEFIVALFLCAPGESVDLSAVTAHWIGDHWQVDVPGNSVLLDAENLEVANWLRPHISLDQPVAGTALIGGPQPVRLAGTVAASGAASIERVEVWDGAQMLGLATLDGGSWSYDLGTLPLGDYADRFHAIAYDSEGNYRQSQSADFTINNTQPPVLHITSPSLVSYHRDPGPVLVEGIAFDPDGSLGEVRILERYNGVWSQIGTATLNPTRGTWSFTTSYSATNNPKRIGRHVYRAVAVDNAGDTATSEMVFSINRQFGDGDFAGDEANYFTDENTAFHSFWADRIDGSEVMRFRQRPEGGSGRADLAYLRDRYMDTDFRLSFDARFEDPTRAALMVGWGRISITLSSHMPDSPPVGWPHDYIMDPDHYMNAVYVLGKKKGNPHIAIDMSYGERNLYHWPNPLVPDDQWHRYVIERVDQTLRITRDDTVLFENGAGTALPESQYFAEAGTLFLARMWHDFPESVWLDNIRLEQLNGNTAPQIAVNAPAAPVGTTPPFATVCLTGTVTDDEQVSRVEIWSGGTLWGEADIDGDTWSFEFTPPHYGNYALYARAEDQRGAQSYSSPVTVHAYHPADAVAPTFTSEPPANILAELGGAVRLDVSVAGYPAPQLQWFKNGEAIVGETGPSLSLANFHPDDRGVYAVRMTSALAPAGVWSSAVTVSSPDPRPPEILAAPVATAVVEGLPAQLSVAADGDPAPAFQWFKNGRAIAGATGNSLAFDAVTLADTGRYSVRVTNAYGSVTSDEVALTVSQSNGLLSRVAYAGASAQTGFFESVRLADGSILIAGTTQNLDWLPAGAPIQWLDASGMPASMSTALGFILHVEADLAAVRACYALPASHSQEIRRMRFSAPEGDPDRALFVSGKSESGYFIGRLNANPETATPTGFAWVRDVPSAGDHVTIQPWDVDADGRVVYLRGGESTFATDPQLRPVIEFLDATGQPRLLPALRASHAVGGAIVRGTGAAVAGATHSMVQFPVDLRSWTEAERTHISSDGNGQIRMGAWPLDLFTTYQIDDASGEPDGVNPVRVENGEAYGYTGYRSAGNHRVGAITIDRRTGNFFVGFNTNSRFWDASANKVQPDFEPAVVAYAADGALLWWSRLYHEVIDADSDRLIDPGETRLSPPDQYVDGLEVDYSQAAGIGGLVVVARSHGNAPSNLWNGDSVARHPGSSAFHNRFTGNEGNIHLSWIGRLDLDDGTLDRATYLGGFFRRIIGGKGNWPSTPYAEEIHDGWPDHNLGWADLTTTMTTPNTVRVDDAGRVHVVGRGPRMVTTSNAFQKLPRRLGHNNPVINEGTAPWNAFVRVYQPDLRTLAYSSALTGDWSYPTGNRDDEPEGADNTALHGVLPLPDGLLVTGMQLDQGNPVPVVNPASWQSDSFAGTTGLIGLLSFQPPVYHEVTFAVVPEGAGSVAGAGSYLFGDVATLTASPAAGFRFIGWTGDVSAASASVDVLVDGDRHLIANFEAIPPSPPTIIAQPQGGQVVEGADVALSVVVEAFPLPTFQWQFNGTPIPNATDATLSLTGVTLAQAGTYRVEVSNSEGSVLSDEAVLEVIESPVAPSISSHPVSRVVEQGTVVELAVVAAGTPAPTYVWEFNGLPISGANAASLSFTATPATSGTYRVRVANLLGEVVSAEATVAVLPAPIDGRLQRIVDWQGDYASGNYGLDRYASATAGEFGDGSADWGVRRAPFSLTETLAPSRRYDRAMPSALFFGGVESWRHGVYNTAVIEVVNAGARDVLRFADSNASNRHLFAVLLWRQQEFLNGLDVEPLQLSDAGIMTAVIDSVLHGFAQVRFVVRADGQFYLSEASISQAGVFALAGEALANSMWAPYDPQSNLQPTPGVAGVAQSNSLVYSVDAASLGSVDMVGLYLERFEFPNGGNPELRLSQFTVMLEKADPPRRRTETWLDVHFADLIADPEADPLLWAWDGDADGDGVPNAIEFVGGTDPRDPTHSAQGVTLLRAQVATSSLGVSLRVPDDGAWNGAGVYQGDGYSVWIEGNAGLAADGWSVVVPVAPLAAPEPVGDGTLRYELTLPVSGTPRFLRTGVVIDP